MHTIRFDVWWAHCIQINRESFWAVIGWHFSQSFFEGRSNREQLSIFSSRELVDQLPCLSLGSRGSIPVSTVLRKSVDFQIYPETPKGVLRDEKKSRIFPKEDVPPGSL